MEIKRNKKKRRTQVTLLVIPDIKTKPSLYNISRRAFIGVLGTAAVFILAFIILGYSHLTDLNNIRHLEDIKQESKAKDLTISQMRQEMDEITKQQEEIDQKQKEIQSLMGVKPENSAQSSPSRGGQSGRADEVMEDKETVSYIQAQDIIKKLSLAEKELDAFSAQIKKDQAYFRRIPNQWPARGEISSYYGLRLSPFGGKTKTLHEGIDIKNQVGTAIVAAADGEVIYAGWMSGYGKAVVINHGNGLETKYGHNSQLLIEKGDKVKKGDMIARMGTTGFSTGPHLHFSITKNGISQDPLSYLQLKP